MLKVRKRCEKVFRGRYIVERSAVLQSGYILINRVYFLLSDVGDFMTSIYIEDIYEYLKVNQ